MQEPEQRLPDQIQDDNPVEITDLGLPVPARHNLSFAVAQRLLRWQRSLTRRQVRLAMGIGILLLVSSVLLFSVHSALQAPLHAQKSATSFAGNSTLPVDVLPARVIVPQRDGFACLADTSWSLDSTYLAFVGYQKNCGLSADLYEPGLLAVYAAHTGKLVKHVQPDRAILSAMRSHYPELQGLPVISYNHVLWSPSPGKQGAQSLVLTFAATASHVTLNGVLLTDLQASNDHVWLHTQGENSSFVEWDLQAGRQVDASIPAGASLTASAGAPSTLTYLWMADGSLVPEIEQIYGAQSGLAAPAPVGNPDGDVTFTAWQPGQVGLTTQVGSGPIHQPGVFTWNTSFAALSPGGRYLVDGVSLKGRLELPGQAPPSLQTLRDLHMLQVPLLAVRDKGLQHVLETLAAAPADLSAQTLAWDPAGDFLATYNAGTLDLDLFDCVTGYQVASLLLPSGPSPSLGGYVNFLDWSPDGKQLLLFDPQLGKSLLWPRV